jgi:hypothetical protein
MIRWAWLVCLLLSPAPRACAGEKPKGPSDREIRALVARLVSPNPKPIIKDDNYREPKGYNRAKQKKVHDAREKLRGLGLKAFPFLIERLEDDRYCLTADDGPAPVNLSVGEVCSDIIFDQLQPYGFWPEGYPDPRGKPKRPSYRDTFLRSKKAARKWWEKNKDKTLYQMQLEALDWVIAEEAKRPRDFTDEERRHLQRLRKKLVKSGKPLPISRGLPVLTKPWS